MLARFLVDHGLRVSQARNGVEMFQVCADARIDVIVLDIMMPGEDGLSLCRRMRAESAVPIILLTAMNADTDRIIGLEIGADDYVVKPFNPRELLARIRAQLRQHERSEDAVFAIGPYSFRPGAKMLIDPETNKKIRLTEKEAAILKYLFRAGQTVIGRDVLLNEVWGYNSGVTTHTLETHVYRLRQKIVRDPSNAEILFTEAGGYRLVP